jgi:hypothetical protein
MQGALHIHDTVGIGALRDRDDVVEAVTAQDIEQRDADLFRGWRVLMGRPLLWMNSVALIGTLQLCGVEGCEPRAAEVARPEIRNHLLGLPDDDRFAAAWRLQRALIRATVRVLTFARLDALVEDLEAVAQLGVSIAWVATHCTEVDVSIQHLPAARELGLETVGFLMMAQMAEPAVLAAGADHG